MSCGVADSDSPLGPFSDLMSGEEERTREKDEKERLTDPLKRSAVRSDEARYGLRCFYWRQLIQQ
jgi:hypothetical protein